MVVTDIDVMQLEMWFLFISIFLKAIEKKSNAGLFKEMRRCVRNHFFYLASQKKTTMLFYIFFSVISALIDLL